MWGGSTVFRVARQAGQTAGKAAQTAGFEGTANNHVTPILPGHPLDTSRPGYLSPRLLGRLLHRRAAALLSGGNLGRHGRGSSGSPVFAACCLVRLHSNPRGVHGLFAALRTGCCRQAQCLLTRAARCCSTRLLLSRSYLFGCRTCHLSRCRRHCLFGSCHLFHGCACHLPCSLCCSGASTCGRRHRRILCTGSLVSHRARCLCCHLLSSSCLLHGCFLQLTGHLCCSLLGGSSLVSCSPRCLSCCLAGCSSLVSRAGTQLARRICHGARRCTGCSSHPFHCHPGCLGSAGNCTSGSLLGCGAGLLGSSRCLPGSGASGSAH